MRILQPGGGACWPSPWGKAQAVKAGMPCTPMQHGGHYPPTPSSSYPWSLMCSHTAVRQNCSKESTKGEKKSGTSEGTTWLSTMCTAASCCVLCLLHCMVPEPTLDDMTEGCGSGPFIVVVSTVYEARMESHNVGTCPPRSPMAVMPLILWLLRA